MSIRRVVPRGCSFGPQVERMVVMVPGNAVTESTFYQRDPGLSRRNEVYLEILKLGFMFIRGAGYHGDHRYCEVEADHLHNVPSYIAGGDAANHLYYLSKEVPLYLKKVDLK